MSRRITWSVAAGATFLFALTGCTQQIGGASAAQNAGQGRSLCAIVTEPVSKALEQAGVHSVAPAAGGTTCTWTDSQSGTSVTLTQVADQRPEKDAETTAVPGAGTVTIVGPQEVRFTVDGRQFQLKLDSKGPVDPAVLFRILTAVSTALSGQSGALPAAPAPQQAGSTAPSSGTGASTTRGDSSVTVTDDKGRTVVLRNSSTRVLGGEKIDLDSGQSVPLRTIATVDATKTSTGTSLVITLADGTKVTGPTGSYVTVSGDSDAGKYELPWVNITKVEFQRDHPFVTTPDPKLGPWTAAKVTIAAEDGTSKTVTGPSFRVLGGEEIRLDTGQQVSLQRIAKIETTHPTTGTELQITLANGKQVTGAIGDYIEFTGDAPGGGQIKLMSSEVKTVEVKR
ncbi:hypothetical protein ACQEVB_00770 [Pseudonocardia sp. CA-107938]|uniref:hypothetical protein n=1 Tax=Pseudonocardia sp. CA-107938 TaxID=3240021 RepID=UPI003D93C000